VRACRIARRILINPASEIQLWWWSIRRRWLRRKRMRKSWKTLENSETMSLVEKLG
jgi:hypothetical protein